MYSLLSIPLGLNMHTFRRRNSNVFDYRVLVMTPLGCYVVFRICTVFPF